MAKSKYDLIIKGGQVIDPAIGFTSNADVFIKDGLIVKIAQPTAATQKEIDKLDDDKIINADGMIVTPGLIDMHVHLREPGSEDKETIATGTRAAAAGGFTSVCCMPNTNPVIDNQEVVRFVLSRAEYCSARVFVIGAITKGLNGEELSEIGELVKSGAVAISDDGKYVQNPAIMAKALEYTQMFDIPIISHAEDENLCSDGVVNESFESTRLGMPGRPAVGEVIAVLRDIKLCQYLGGRVHIAHVSTAEAVDAIRQAKVEGVNITAEATPHHFTLTDVEIGKAFDTSLRVNPPIRTQKDVDAIIAGLVDGTIDCIASDHAPHSEEDKDCEFDHAPPGMVGLETTVGLVKTYLVDKGYLSWADAISKMTVNPARILGLPGGTLEIGKPADIAVINPKKRWTVSKKKLHSKSKNSPFIGMRLNGKTMFTILDGKVVYSE